MNNIQIGNTVQVVSLTDETALPEFLGKEGTVTNFNTNGQTGNTVDDPLIEVHFPDGTKDQFWKEELKVL